MADPKQWQSFLIGQVHAKDAQLAEKEKQMRHLEEQLAEREEQLAEREEQLYRQEEQLLEQKEQLEQQTKQLAQQKEQLSRQEVQLGKLEALHARHGQQRNALQEELQQTVESHTELGQMFERLAANHNLLVDNQSKLKELQEGLVGVVAQLTQHKTE